MRNRIITAGLVGGIAFTVIPAATAVADIGPARWTVTNLTTRPAAPQARTVANQRSAGRPAATRPPGRKPAPRRSRHVAGQHHRARPVTTHRQAGRTWPVESGDTLSLVAAVTGVSIDRIAARNGIRNPDLIRIGQLLHIPAGS